MDDTKLKAALAEKGVIIPPKPQCKKCGGPVAIRDRGPMNHCHKCHMEITKAAENGL